MADADDEFLLMDNLAQLNWQEVSMLLNEVEQHGMPDTHSSVMPWPPPQQQQHPRQPGLVPQQPSPPINLASAQFPAFGQKRGQHDMLSPSFEHECKEAFGSPTAEHLAQHGFLKLEPQQPPPSYMNHSRQGVMRPRQTHRTNVAEMRTDPAPPGAYTFDDVHRLLSDAQADNFADFVQRRFGVSPVNPDGPRAFFVVDRTETMEVPNLYMEEAAGLARAVRLRSTKKLHWMDERRGLQYRELAKKERKTGETLEFGGCLYTLATRAHRNATCDIPAPGLQFLQLWYLQHDGTPAALMPPLPYAGFAGGESREALMQQQTQDLQLQQTQDLQLSPRSHASSSVAAQSLSRDSSAGAEPAFPEAKAAPELGPVYTAEDLLLPELFPEDDLAFPQPHLQQQQQHNTQQQQQQQQAGEAPALKRVALRASSPKADRPKAAAGDGASAADLGTLDEVQSVVFEIFNRFCENLQPAEWRAWTEKYSRFLSSDNFAKALKLYVRREDPRLREDFIFPDKMLETLPVGVFRATVDADISSNGGTCVFCDDAFKAMVEQDPTGMKGFFVSVLSPLQRLCISRVWWKKMAEEGMSYGEFFATWRITQSAYTLHNGTVKVLRTNNRLMRDEEGRLLIECKSQDVTHLYPEIVRLPPFLA